MKDSTKRKIDWLREQLLARYQNYWGLPLGERALLAAAYLCDDVGVREKPENRGDWVEAFQDSAGVGPGSYWCAAFVTFCVFVAAAATGYQFPSWIKVKNRASVKSWADWAKANGKLTSLKRGVIVYLVHQDGTGHIGFDVASALGFTKSIEGNTSSGKKGSQRNGDGLYRRTQLSLAWQGGIAI